MIKNSKLKIKNTVIVLLIFLFALCLRLYGLNWDQGQHLHPDERFLTMVATDIKLPKSIIEYFDDSKSPLNPYNYPSYQFFVYGTFPLFLTKLFSVIFHLDNYENIVLVGRILSAVFDAGIILILYKITNRFLAPLFYATTVLPLQLSHFFAVDTFLNFFIFLTFYLLTKRRFVLGAITFGLALACKISAIYFLPIIGLLMLFNLKINQNLFITVRLSVICVLLSFLSFRIFQPYAFVNIFDVNPVFIKSLQDIQVMSVPSLHFPPSIQWMTKTTIIFPIQNIIIFGLGVPLSLAFIFIKKIKKNSVNVLSIIWILFLLMSQGTQSVFSIRYFLPFYPFIILIISQIVPRKLLIFFLIPHFIYCLMFLTIYSVPHSRVQASNWINSNFAPSSVLSTELWDDALPLNNNAFQIVTLQITGPDTPKKWQTIYEQLKSIDYIVLSSNRSWASVTTVPNLFPDTINFYKKLFSHSPLVEINSYPGFRLPIDKCYYFGPTNKPNNSSWFAKNICNYPGIYFRDDLAEEAFSVYDHPKVLIFKNNKLN